MKICLLIIFVFACADAIAQSGDKNIVMQSKTQDFRFVKEKGDNPVQIKESYSNLYRCNDYRTSIQFDEMYNDRETIDDVTIKVDDKRAKYITPKNDYYSVEGIFYSDAKVCYFNLPLEKKGSTSEVILEKTYSDPRYFTSVYFNEAVAVENKTISFHIPKWMKLELKEYNFNGYNIQKSNSFDDKKDEDVITYTIKNLPQQQSENAAPGNSYFLPHILVMCKQAMLDKGTVTYFNTVADQYAWYKTLVDGLDTDTATLNSKAKEITAGITGDEQKVAAIFNWMHRNIRYLAFENGIAGFKPAKAIDVLSKKYGDCKGMANLTKNLLKGIGLDARLCWIGTNHIAYDYSTPSLSVDNHMICCWMCKGKKIFLDATETNIGLNEYAERIQGRQVLIEDGSKYILEKVPATTPEQNMQKEKVVLAFDGETNLKGTVSLVYKGESRSGLLSQIQSVKKDNLEKTLTNYLAEGNQDYAINDLKTSDLQGKDSVLKMDYNLAFKNGASAFGNEIYVEMDYRKELSDFTIDTAKRTTDKVLPHKMHSITEVELAIPAGYKANPLPANQTWHHANADISITYKMVGNKISYKKEIILKQVMLKKAGFAEWNKMITALTNQYKEQITLVKG